MPHGLPNLEWRIVFEHCADSAIYRTPNPYEQVKNDRSPNPVHSSLHEDILSAEPEPARFTPSRTRFEQEA